MSPSHAPFFLVSFFFLPFHFLSWWCPVLQPHPQKSLSQTVSCHGNFSGQCSPCCRSCSALWDPRFATENMTFMAKRREAFSKSNEPTNFCCILSVWMLAGNLRMPPGLEKPQSHLYIVLFLMFVRACVGGSVWVYLKAINQCGKEKENRTNTGSVTTKICWAEEAASHLQSFYAMNHIQRDKGRKANGQSRTVIVYHTSGTSSVPRLHCFASSIDRNKEIVWTSWIEEKTGKQTALFSIRIKNFMTFY